MNRNIYFAVYSPQNPIK